jgi:uncharacterized protein YyaL (SSP411 family)
VFERPDRLEMAKSAFAFVTSRMEKDGRLIHSFRAGQARAPATASDYANMIWGAIRLHEATNDPTYLAAAERWTDTLDRHYWLAEAGGYAFTANDTPDVIVRMRSAHDDATPNANAVMISSLVALNLLTGKQAYLDRAFAIPAAFAADLGRNALGHCGILAGYFDLLAPQHVVVIEPAVGGTPGSRLAQAMFDLSLPGAVQQFLPAEQPLASPALASKTVVEDKPTAYACVGPQCSLPVTDPEALSELLHRQRAAALAP